jgi:hypothetical protein
LPKDELGDSAREHCVSARSNIGLRCARSQEPSLRLGHDRHDRCVTILIAIDADPEIDLVGTGVRADSTAEREYRINRRHRKRLKHVCYPPLKRLRFRATTALGRPDEAASAPLRFPRPI